MFYFHDPLMNATQPPVTPPAMSRVVEAPASPLAPPKGWQWANSKSSSAVAPGAAAPGAAAGGDEDQGKKAALPSPPTQTPLPSEPCAVSPAARAWQPPKGYIAWTTPCECRQTVKVQPHIVAAPAAIPTWSIVSWKNLAPRRLTGTKEEVIAQVESDLAAAGVHHLDIQIYSAVHTIVALQKQRHESVNF
ncbi:hypothetical protein [Acidithiobacillus sp.]